MMRDADTSLKRFKLIEMICRIGGMEKREKAAERLGAFIERSTSPFHVVRNVEKMLECQGFIRLDEKERFNLEKGRSYFVERGGTALIAFRIPEKAFRGLSIIASHTDSPSFRIKNDPDISKGPYTVLNTEGYGGMLMAPWFDRPLSIAGRVVVSIDGKIETRIYEAGRDLLLIPSLAIHMDRKANEGIHYSAQKDLLPLFSLTKENESFSSMLGDELGVRADDILGYDLNLYARDRISFWGRHGEFFSAPRIDNLSSVWASAEAIAETEGSEYMPLIALFDNEETGSGTRCGALSDFLPVVVSRIASSLSMNREEELMMIASSFMLSSDNGHAVHPNYMEKADPTNHPQLNGGVLIKYSAAQKYMTDSESGAFVKSLCLEEGIPFQVFHNHSDIPGGSTLGNLSAESFSVHGADVGLAQLAMHSPYESAGTDDPESILRLFKAFLRR